PDPRRSTLRLDAIHLADLHPRIFRLPIFSGASVARIVLTLAGGAVFLVLYFVGHWLKGPALLGVIAAITLLGIIFIPINLGAASFFIYAAAFAGSVGDSRRGMWVIAGILVVLLIEVKAFDLEWFRWWWGALFTLIIGAVN